MNWSPTLRVFLTHGGRDFLAHKTLTLLNIAALAVGVGAIVAIQTVNETALRSFRASLDLVAGRPDFTVEGQGFRIPESLLPIARADPSVREATPVLQVVASLPAHPGEFLHLVGVDPFSNGELVTYRLEDALKNPADAIAFVSEADTIAVTLPLAERLGLKIGDTLRAVHGGRETTLRVRFLLEPSDDLVGADDHLALADIATVQSRFQLGGQIDRIETLLRANSPAEKETARQALTERLLPHLPAHARAGSPERRGREVERMLGAFQLNLTALSLIALVVGMFLVTNTVAANVARRRSEFGLLRALGLGRRALTMLIVAESLLLALAGSALGVWAGLEVARHLLGTVASTVTSHYVLLSMREVMVSPASLIGAVAAGLVAAALAAWWPAREAARVSPVDALQIGNISDRAVSRSGRFVLPAIISLAAAGLFSLTALRGGVPQTGFLAALGVLLAAAFAAPMVAHALARLPPAQIPGWILARSFFLRGLHRHGLATAALAVSVGMALGVAIMVHSFRATVDRWIGQSIRADLFIAPSTNLVAGSLEPLDPEAETVALALPGIRAVGSYREIRLFLDGTPAKLAACKLDVLKAYNPLPILSSLPGDPYEMCRNGDFAFVSENFARRRHLQPGDTVSLPTPQGLREIRVAAIFRDYTTESGLLLLDRAIYQKITGDLNLTSLALHLEPGTPVQPMIDSIRAQLRPRGEFLIYSQSALRDEALRIFDRSFAVTELLRTLAIGVAALGVTLSLTALLAERTREIGVLRATGARRGQVLRTLMTEAGYLGVTGVSLGAATGFAVALVLMQVINRAFFGWTIDWHTPWTLLGSILVFVFLVCLLAGLPPRLTGFPAFPFGSPAFGMRTLARKLYYPVGSVVPTDHTEIVEPGSFNLRHGPFGERTLPKRIFLPIFYLLSTIFFCQPLLAEDWQRALQPWSWQFPRDHGAHPAFKTEWWYLTGNLQDASGNPYGYQLTFFRHGLQPVATQTGSAWAVRDVYFGHLALTDGKANRFYFSEKLSRGALGEASFATNDCSVRLGDWTLRRTKDSVFQMKAWAPEENFGLDLAARPIKSAAFHGNGGLSQKSASPGNASHYYSYTRMETKGELRIGERRIPVSGLSWLDREFSTSALAQDQEGWDWFCLQFDSGEELMLYRMRNPGDRTDPSSSGTWIPRSGPGVSLKSDGFTVEALGRWKAPGGKVYPSGWKISVPSLNLEGEVQPLMADQELRLRRIGNLRYWEGACTFQGARSGKPLTGRGYTELTGYATPIGQGMKE